MEGSRFRPRFFVRLGLGFGVLGLMVYGASAAALARLERSEALRGRLEAAVRNEFGLSLESDALELGFVPPRVRLTSAAVALPDGAELHFDHATLYLSLVPLLRGLADLKELSADGHATLVVAGASLSGEAALRIVRRSDDGWRAELSGKLATGGSFEGDCTTDATGGLHAVLIFDRVEMSPLSSLLLPQTEPRSELAGVFSGTVDVDTQLGAADARPAKLTLRLESPRARIVLRDISVDGPVRIDASTDGSRLAFGGFFEVDAGAARVEYAGGMQKASGTGATLRGQVDWRGGELALGDLRLSVTAFEGQVGAPHSARRGSDER